MRQPVLYFFCCFLAFCCLSTFLSFAAANDNGQVANRNRGYVFTAPKRLIAGEKKNVCLSLHNLEPPVHVSVDLLATAASSSGGSANASISTVDREDDVLASIQTTLKTGIESCMELRVTANTKYSVASLRLRLQHPDYVVEAQKRIFIEHDALVTFVETDKAIYKPGQDVNLRILNLKHDLKPWTKPVRLRVLKPNGSSPAPNEKIQVCLRIRRKDEWQRSVVECRNFTSADADGFLSFIVPPQHKSIVLLSFVATAVDYPNKYYDNKRWRVS
ncbi:pregnancy zone protein-like [Copidosoma floridanum]|uniref:pregnancy zone protein-like n=1 Tax=Copidosoma floridanum TaxID=29053 RepID=UPI000C6F5179|nr:pregnancy zone protein-like [Copidosoma floridanum]